MEVRIVACGIFQPELDLVLEQVRAERAPGIDIRVTCVAPALHVDYDKLKAGIIAALDAVTEERAILFFGFMCHPELDDFTAKYHVVRLAAGNCIELILGKERQQEIEKSARVFYLALGWLQNWQDIFKQGLGWDEIDARMNLGFYDQILLLDTGVCKFSDDQILEFFEYTQVPIAIESVSLEVFKKNVNEALDRISSETAGDLH